MRDAHFQAETKIASGLEGGLSAKSLSYSHDGHRLIYDVTMSLPKTGIHCIMGPNGAGKSLTLRLLHGLLEPEGGEVLWRGQPVSSNDRARQAMVFQKPVLLRRSVAANIDFVLRARKSKDPSFRDALLARVGLDRPARQPARALSGGEQQRLALARALATRPEVLFLDEPTASLDPTSAQMIEDILQHERERGTLCVLVTHDVGQARRLADTITFLDQGRVCERAHADRFFQSPQSAEARSYLNNQMIL